MNVNVASNSKDPVLDHLHFGRIEDCINDHKPADVVIDLPEAN